MKNTLRKRVEALQKVVNEMKKCKTCNKYKVGLIVPGEGAPNSKIMFVGEAAGPTESKVGLPFVGRSGKFLTQVLRSIGIDRKEVYLTSPVKYYPGKRVLKNEEIMHGRTHLLKQIKVIQPKLFVLLGNVALKALFPEEKLSVLKIHGRLIKKNDKFYFPTFHPSAARRFPKVRKKVLEDFKKLKLLINKLKLR